jgi:hypothetical protein
MNIHTRLETQPPTRSAGELPALSWKMGFEIELLAPRGQSRESLARRIAADIGGSVERFSIPSPSRVWFPTSLPLKT